MLFQDDAALANMTHIFEKQVRTSMTPRQAIKLSDIGDIPI